jgi:hypothetical protein
VTLPAYLGIVESLQEPALVEQLGRACGEPHPAGFPAAFGSLLEDGNIYAAKAELTREHQPRWPGTDNNYISIHFLSSAG